MVSRIPCLRYENVSQTPTALFPHPQQILSYSCVSAIYFSSVINIMQVHRYTDSICSLTAFVAVSAAVTLYKDTALRRIPSQCL